MKHLILKKRANSLKYFLGFFLAILFYSPIAINLIQVGGKPIDLTFSDVVIFSLLCVYCVILASDKITKLEGQLLLLVFLVLLGHAVLAIFGTLEVGSIVPILSALKYVKVFLALIAGICFARLCSIDNFWRVSTLASLCVVLGLCVAQFIQLGTISPRWGRYLFGFPVYGFPNSPASYYVILVMFSVVACIRKLGALRYVVSALLTMMFILMSLSRGAVVVLLFFLLMLPFFWFSLRSFTRLISISFILVMITFLVVESNEILFENHKISAIKNTLETRWNRTFSANDPTSGRISIAIETLSLVSEKPIYGYKFDSFSHYHYGHDTPHNQYLEALFKTGFLGATMYFFILFLFIYVLLRKVFFPGVSQVDRRSIICFLFALISLMVGNLVQPNFTYSQTGNVVFFMLGFFALAKPHFSPITPDRINKDEVGITKYE